MEKVDKIWKVLETNESLANAIRRSVNEIPNVAIDLVEIHKNDSALYDEVVAHRVGLIPLKASRTLAEFKEGDKPSNKNEIKVALKVKGPGTVYAGEMKGDVEVLYPKMPITLLGKSHELELVGFVRVGKGTDHAKFSPGFIHYRHVSEVTVKDAEKAKAILEKAKDTLLEPMKDLKVGSVLSSAEDVDYFEAVDSDGALEVKPGEKLVFFVESWGQIQSKEIFSQAVKALDSNLKEVLKAVK